MNVSRRLAIAVAALSASMAISATAFATSGPGCFRPVNVPAGDVLNVRSGPSAGTSLVTSIDPDNAPIIAQRGRCGRWCSVSIYDGDSTYRGWIRRKFLRASDCP